MSNQERKELQNNELSQEEIRLSKIATMKQEGVEPWPVILPDITARVHDVVLEFDSQPGKEYSLAGRLMLIREHGKTIFADLQDGSGKVQLYIKQDIVSLNQFSFFQKYIDLGDILSVFGTSFKTKMGEITLQVSRFALLSKCVRPLPEKFHGLTDTETRYRQRYLDLITNKESKTRFLRRSQIITLMRRFFDDHGYIEVETPMLHPIPGGALARPFVTHHNALDMELYLRIAPELYLKRLIVGGIERVYEINRNFRNEGISTRHNPEFTMVEFYTAYAQFPWMINFVEAMIKEIVKRVCQQPVICFGEHELDFSCPFKKISMIDAVAENVQCKKEELQTIADLQKIAKKHAIRFKEQATWGELLAALFEECVEKKLIQPTFITDFPVEISPLAKRSAVDDRFVDRFELFIAGMELSNGYNELNDPFDQAKRFHEQLAGHKTEEEQHSFDADYIRALEYALAPTVGVGIGIDRLVMFLTDAPSIRDVILFPTLRRKDEEQ